MAKKANEKEIEVSVAEVVDYLRVTGGFLKTLHDVVVRKITLNAARKSRLKVSSEELQKAADAFRVVNGLSKASDTEKWLRANGITVETLEDYLETNLLINKFKNNLEKKTSKTKFLTANPVKENLREAIYKDWIAKNL